jgi:prepilin-type N-terminal cleavage/methylation domain-containing protein
MRRILVDERGFTLIELLVVIAIIGILMGIVVAVINPATILIRSRQSVAKANVARVCEAARACYAAMNRDSLCDSDAEIGVTFPSGVSIDASYNVVATRDSCTYTCDISDTGGVTQSGTCYTPT